MDNLQIELARTIQEDRLREAQSQRLVQEVLAGPQKQSKTPTQTLAQWVRSLARLKQRAVPEAAS